MGYAFVSRTVVVHARIKIQLHNASRSDW